MSILLQVEGVADGEILRDAALNRLRVHRAALIREFCIAAIRIALDQGEVCADDVRAAIPIPDEIDPKFVGAVFRDLADEGILRRVTFKPSARRIAHARPISQWRLADPAAAVSWLASHPPLPTD